MNMAPLEDAFAVCVTQLNSGASVDVCLASHAEEAVDLSPLLRIVAALHGLAAPAPAMNPNTAQLARARFMARANGLSQQPLIQAEDALAQSADTVAAGIAAEECLDAFPHYAAELRPNLAILAAFQQVSQPAPAPDPAERATARATFLAHAQAMAAHRAQPMPIEEALDASLSMIAAGETIEACLQAHPAHATELRPALTITSALQAQLAQPAPARPESAMAAQRKAFVASAQATRRRSLTTSQVGAGWLQALRDLFRQPAWARVAAVLLMVALLFSFGRVAVTMAAGALPGDALYPIKLATEQARMLVTTDESQRAELRQQFEQGRRAEAAVVVEQGRQVQVQFSGVIESMVDGEWRIAGLDAPLLAPGDAVVRGQPAVGAHVIILAYSDGAGHLVIRQALVLEPAKEPAPSPTFARTPTSQPLFIAPLPPAAATWTPPPRLTPTLTPVVSLTRTPTRTSTPSGTPTDTPSGTPTGTGTPTVTGTPTPAPVPVQFNGAIQEKNAAQWLISGRTVRITNQTVIDESQRPAVVGAQVDVLAMPQPDGSLLGLMIRVQASAPGADYFTDIIHVIGSSEWQIGNRWVTVTGSTEIIGAPAVGKTARVWLARPAGGSWAATRIEIEEDVDPVYIDGIISSLSSSEWTVGGYRITITDATVITGATPQVGHFAQVEARPSGNAFVALFIFVVAPDPTATWTATPASPTMTPTPEPTATFTPEPTATFTPEPTATFTPEPTATFTPEPTATFTPESTATFTPEPAATIAPEPTATPQPPTNTPEAPTNTPQAAALPLPLCRFAISPFCATMQPIRG